MKPMSECLMTMGAVLLAALCFPAAPAQAKLSVLSSPHNLSATGGRGTSSGEPGVTFSEEGQVCVFCHVPHKAMSGTPLWSRQLPAETAEYKPYAESSTLKASPRPDRPTGASRLCLSCHDGTIALSKYTGSPIMVDRYMPTNPRPAFNANLSTDLRDDHPISFLYTEALAAKAGLVPPSSLPGQVRLEKGVSLECTACHDPHDNQYGKFLVMNNGDPSKPDFAGGSPLCSACHIPAGWQNSTHNDPTVPSLSKGCLECHMVHNAQRPVRLLAWGELEQNCMGSCHDGKDIYSTNVKPLFALNMHRHPVEFNNPEPSQEHDEMESLPAEFYHVQCVDCHSPHQVNEANSPMNNPPAISGRLRGVRKDTAGNYATTEYDVCFKCHAGPWAERFYGVTEVRPDRMIPEPDQAKRFDLRNPSFHPVTADRRSQGASLLLEIQVSMVRVYCIDCHNSDQSSRISGGSGGANGPHGSQFPHILAARYDMPFVGATREPYNNALYSLCFRCHSASYVMESGTAFSSASTAQNHHATHVRDRQIPCFVCHDPHGVSWQRGGTATNNAHLINFDKSYAAGTVVANPVYTSESGGGNCTVNCHTNSGNNHAYGAAAAAARSIIRPTTLRPALPRLPLPMPR
jgi:hypothetical protein